MAFFSEPYDWLTEKKIKPTSGLQMILDIMQAPVKVDNCIILALFWNKYKGPCKENSTVSRNLSKTNDHIFCFKGYIATSVITGD